MITRLAFLGFRHGHILSVFQQAQKRDDVEIVAVSEDDDASRRQLAAQGISFTHDNCLSALAESNCDAVAIGDYYGNRGPLAIAALKAGKHIILDKPICTRLNELEQIAALACSQNLSVGCQLDLRHTGKYRRLRTLLAEGTIGEVHAIGFGGQHPLHYGSRPDWYFEKGKHGGTLNDIAIHAVDLIPWLTGHKFRRIDAARNWNAACLQVPHFRDAAQMMATLENDCGVIGDVSYLSPNSIGYRLPMYWRVTCWGSRGVFEVDSAHAGILYYADGAEEGVELEPDADGPGAFDSFLNELRGTPGEINPGTAEVLASARVSLMIQKAADDELFGVLV